VQRGSPRRKRARATLNRASAANSVTCLIARETSDNAHVGNVLAGSRLGGRVFGNYLRSFAFQAEALFALRGCCVLRQGQGLPPLSPAPLSPLAALFLRCAPDKFSLTKPNTSCTIEMPASLRSEGVRVHPGMPFGFPSETAFGFAGILTQERFPRAHLLLSRATNWSGSLAPTPTIRPFSSIKRRRQPEWFTTPLGRCIRPTRK
jgi:hypothetical protein